MHGQRGAFYQTTVVWEWVDKRVRRQAWGPAGRWNQALFVLFVVLCLFGLLPAEWLKLWQKNCLLTVFSWTKTTISRREKSLDCLCGTSESFGLHCLKMSSNVWNLRSHWICSRTVGIYYLAKKWLIKCPVGICRHLIDGAHLAVFSVFSSMVPLIKQTDKQKTYKVWLLSKI